jgi:hypothetical protein
MPDKADSLELVWEEARSEREAQLRHFDSLDQRSGIILGFSAVLVAVAPEAGALVSVGRVLGAIGGLLSLASFMPRKYPVLALRVLRDKYRNAEPAFTKRRLLDSTIQMVEEASRGLMLKARLLTASTLFLAAGVLLVAAGTL